MKRSELKALIKECIIEESKKEDYLVTLRDTANGFNITLGKSRYPDFVYKFDKKENQYEIVKDQGRKNKPKTYYIGPLNEKKNRKWALDKAVEVTLKQSILQVADTCEFEIEFG